jgi:hypothetical protein
VSGVYLYCPRCRLRIAATLGQLEAPDGSTCPTCVAMDGMAVPMFLVSRPPDNNRLRAQPGGGRAAPTSGPVEAEQPAA